MNQTESTTTPAGGELPEEELNVRIAISLGWRSVYVYEGITFGVRRNGTKQEVVPWHTRDAAAMREALLTLDYTEQGDYHEELAAELGFAGEWVGAAGRVHEMLTAVPIRQAWAFARVRGLI
jgi:hypothetical protein